MESNESSNRVTPLSAGLFRRREHAKIQTTEQQLRSIFEDIVEEHVSAKITRLESSINRMISQFEGIHGGEASDAALRVTTDQDAVDLASVSIEIPTEDYYKYTCSDLAERLSFPPHRVLQKIKQLKLRNNLRYHKSIKTGKVGHVQKWSEETFVLLKKEFDSDKKTLSNNNALDSF
jgi:hypothetical protein